MTAFYIAAPVLAVLTVIVLALHANRKFNFILDQFNAIDPILTNASEALRDGSTSLLPSQTFIDDALAVFQSAMDDLVDRWIAALIGWEILNSTFLVVFVFAVYVQWRDLRESIAKVNPSGDSAGNEQHSRHLARLLWSYRCLALTSGFALTLLVSYIALNIPLLIKKYTTLTLTGHPICEALIMGQLWSNTLFGSLIDVVLFVFAINTYQDRQSQTSAPTYSIFRRPPKSSATPSDELETIDPGVTVNVELTVGEVIIQSCHTVVEVGTLGKV